MLSSFREIRLIWDNKIYDKTMKVAGNLLEETNGRKKITFRDGGWFNFYFKRLYGRDWCPSSQDTIDG